MRLLPLIAVTCFIGCNNSSTSADMGGPDLQAPMDFAVQGDLSAVAPFNMPGQIDCYNGPLCSTTSATPVCCDARVDGGFTDNCVASATACLAIDPKAKPFACGQAADCGAGMICCGSTGTSSSGKTFFKSTQCATMCASGDTQLCVTATECKTAGAHCLGQSITGRDVGLCK